MIGLLIILGLVWGCIINHQFRKAVGVVGGIGWLVLWIATGDFLAAPMLFIVTVFGGL